MYDPISRTQHVKGVVCTGNLRKYHRFRPARFYGGIATADCVGCCLQCIFCWSWRQVSHPEKYGRQYSPAAVVDQLIAIARKKGFSQIRISGNEPTLCREHLLEVLSLVPREFRFILETNGILLGQEADYAADLAAFPNLHVRVGIKGASAEEFSRLTGAQPAAFALQLAALQNLTTAGVSSHPAVMVSFSSADNLKTLRNQLAAIAPHYRDFEAEEVVLYGDTGKRLIKAHLLNSESHSPLPTKM